MFRVFTSKFVLIAYTVMLGVFSAPQLAINILDLTLVGLS